jgi:L-ribulose-5-phosphate 3-epimerase
MTDRRRFLQSSLALGSAALAAKLPIGGARAADDLRGRLKKGVIFSMFNETDLGILDRFKALQDAGFDGVELRINEKDERKSFREAVEKTGLVAHSIMNAGEPDLEAAVSFAADVGATAILYVGRYDRKRPLMESWREAQETVRRGLPAAERHGVKILIENVWAGFLFSPLDMERFVDEIDHPFFGAYYDIGNNARWGVPEHWFEILGPRIGRLHIKEWDERKHVEEGLRAGFSVEIGEGTIDWAAVRAAIVAIDYQGWITAEVRGGDRARMAEIAGRMDRVLGLGGGSAA